jgi:Flp pilus assembly protein TadG
MRFKDAFGFDVAIRQILRIDAPRLGAFHRFIQDQSGSYVIISALLMPVLVGTAGLGTEVGWWYYKHKNMQSAADSGAVSAATAVTAGGDLTAEANAVTANYGYANAVNNVTITVNQPPKSGSYRRTCRLSKLS